MKKPLLALARVAVALALGFSAGVFGSFQQLQTDRVGPVALPWGLAVGLLATLCAMTAAAVLGVLARMAAVLGWFAAVGLAATRTRSGDLVVTASWQGYGWLLGGVLTVIATMVWRGWIGDNRGSAPTSLKREDEVADKQS